MHYKEVKAILSPQNGLNIYRGCSYSCVFCDARSTCHRMDHEFEDIEVKAHAGYAGVCIEEKADKEHDTDRFFVGAVYSARRGIATGAAVSEPDRAV